MAADPPLSHLVLSASSVIGSPKGSKPVAWIGSPGLAQMTRRAQKCRRPAQVRLASGRPSRPETVSQQPSEAASPDLLMVAHRFPAVLMLHRLAALAVTCATFPARAHEPAARPAPGSHAWIIRQDASAPAGRRRARIRRPVLAAVCTQTSTGGGRRHPEAGSSDSCRFRTRLAIWPGARLLIP